MAALTYPAERVLDTDRYFYAYAVLEAIRLKHNTRAYDYSPEANFFRRECVLAARKPIADILAMRPRVRSVDPRTLRIDEDDAVLVTLKSGGKAEHTAVDIKIATGTDLDAVTGSLTLDDPLEDFTTYTYGHDNNRVTITANKLDINGLTRNDNVWVYDDKGADHFGATFEHSFKVTPRAYTSTGTGAAWALSESVVDDMAVWAGANSEALTFQIYGGGSDYYRLRDWKTAVSDVTADSFWSNNTPDYPIVERTSETALEARIYSDAGHSAWRDTLAVSITSGDRYRNVFGCNSYDDDRPDRVISYDVEDLDLNEAEPTTTTTEAPEPTTTTTEAPEPTTTTTEAPEPTTTTTEAPEPTTTTTEAPEPTTTTTEAPEPTTTTTEAPEPTTTTTEAPEPTTTTTEAPEPTTTTTEAPEPTTTTTEAPAPEPTGPVIAGTKTAPEISGWVRTPTIEGTLNAPKIDGTMP